MSSPATPEKWTRWPIYGHDWAVEFLRRSIANRRHRHAYLITGPGNIGKRLFAHAFAMALNCRDEDENARPCGVCRSCRLVMSGNHPDLVYTDTDENSGQLKIDTIREAGRMLALKPFDSRYRIAIMDDFHRAQPRAQDALLKTLEEPPPLAVLLLIAESTEGVMPTIISRCQHIPLRPISQAEVEQALLNEGAEAEQADLIARLSGGRIGWALAALHNPEVMERRQELLSRLEEALQGDRRTRFAIADDLGGVDKPTLREMLETWQTYWRDLLLLVNNSPVKPCNTDRLPQMQRMATRMHPDDALRALQATRKLLYETLETNANTRLALEVLFLSYPGL